jgi:hypothetical protein
VPIPHTRAAGKEGAIGGRSAGGNARRAGHTERKGPHGRCFRESGNETYTENGVGISAQRAVICRAREIRHEPPTGGEGRRYPRSGDRTTLSENRTPKAGDLITRETSPAKGTKWGGDTTKIFSPFASHAPPRNGSRLASRSKPLLTAESILLVFEEM